MDIESALDIIHKNLSINSGGTELEAMLFIRTAIAEAQKQSTPSTNTSSPKLPEIEEWIKHVESCKGGYPLSDGQLMAIESSYEFIVGNFGR